MENKSNKPKRTKLTGDIFKTVRRNADQVSLDDYTPGEICYLGAKYCNFPASTLPCKGVCTERVKALEDKGAYAVLVAKIFRAVALVKEKISMCDFNATTLMRGRDMVVVSTEPVGRNGSSHAVLFESKDALKTPDQIYNMVSAEEAAKVFCTEGVWSRCVRVDESDEDDLVEKLAVKESMAFANSLLKYEAEGTVSSNCMSKSAKLAAWDLTTPAKDLAALFKDKKYEVPRNFLYDVGVEDAEMRTMVMDTVSVNMGGALKKQVFGKTTKSGHAARRKGAAPFPRPARYEKPVERLSSISSSIGESRIGNVSLAQMDGLPVDKEIRKNMMMLRDVEIPAKVDVVLFTSGNAAECELLWRRTGYKASMLFMYPNVKTYKGIQFRSYFQGTVKKGGVVAYNPNALPDLSAVTTLYIDHNVQQPNCSTKIQLSKLCSDALEGLIDSTTIGQQYTYYMVCGHISTTHKALWDPKNKEAKNPLMTRMYTGDTHKNVDMYAYVSARYARLNFLVTNYLRKDVDPIPIVTLATVYANLAVWHVMHPATRHIVLTYPYVKTVDNKRKICRYRMFSPVQYYPFGSGRHQDLLAYDDDELAEYFQTHEEVATTIPLKFVRGRRNVKNEDEEDASDAEDEWPSEDDEQLEDEFAGLEEEPVSTSAKMASFLKKAPKPKVQTLASMKK